MKDDGFKIIDPVKSAVDTFEIVTFSTSYFNAII